MSFFSDIFSRPKSLELSGRTDWHCHILPGVDDGVETIDEALDVLSAYEQAGIKEVWLTPHIMEDIPNSTEDLKNRFEELRNAWQGSVALHLAAENMIDNLFFQRLDSGDLLPIGEEGNTLLVETSYFNAPMRFKDTIKEIRKRGFNVLLAHPERYGYITSFSTYRELKEMGVLFQVNLMSLCGYYGQAVRDKAHKLLSGNMYDRAGSDLHSIDQLDVIFKMKLQPVLLEKIYSLSR